MNVDKHIPSTQNNELISPDMYSKEKGWRSQCTPVEGCGALISDILGANIPIHYGKPISSVSVRREESNFKSRVKCRDSSEYIGKKRCVQYSFGCPQVEASGEFG